jgi:ABC-type multidrug transport system ATPase subunit
MDLIQLRNIHCRYPSPKTEVFQDLDLVLKAREFVSLLGHNGAGKTTLLKLIYGILKPQSGDVRINRDVVGTYKDIFLLSETFGISRELSLRENLIFRSKLFGEPVDAILSHRYIAQFNLSKHVNKPVSALSSGLAKRANLVAGLVFDPELVMLDEPTNSIDPATKELMSTTLKALKAAGKTILLVTHDLEFSYALSDRVVILNEGEIVVDEDLGDVPTSQAFKERYLHFTETIE